MKYEIIEIEIEFIFIFRDTHSASLFFTDF